MSTTSHAGAGYRPDIDGLRAIAVLAVVIFHAFPSLVRGGFAGVDVFFVISGFLITGIILEQLKQQRFSYLGFYRRRIQRIFPALLLVLCSTYLFGWFFLLPNELHELDKHTAAGAGFVSNFAYWHGTDYFDASSETLPLLHLWSLGVEEQFYIFWPLIFGYAWQRGCRPLAITAAIACASFLISAVHTNVDPQGAFYSPVARFWELLAGAALACLHRGNGPPRADPRIANIQSSIGTAILLASLALITPKGFFLGFGVVLPCLGAYLVIAAGSEAWLNRVVFSNRWLVFFGLISYPLYLWHWPVLAFTRILDPLPSRGIRLLGVCLSVLLSYLTYIHLENHLRRARSKAVVTALVGGMICVGGFALADFTGLVTVKPISPVQAALTKPYPTRDLYRYRTCFLDTSNQGPGDFAPSCVTATGDRGFVLIWGDSHAAHLYPGLRHLHDALGFRLAQRTATSCPPFLNGNGTADSHCDEINVATQDFILRERPTIVVLGSRWSRDAGDLGRKLEGTVEFLRRSGVKRIVLVGSPPMWTPNLLDVLMRQHQVVDQVPERLEPPADGLATARQADQDLAAISRRLDVSFVSITERFCNNQGCLVRVGNDLPDALISSDYDHMTKLSSEFLFDDGSVRALFETP